MNCKTNKNRIAAVFAAAILCICMLVCTAYAAQQDEGVNLAMDVVFVVDCSTSMKTSDPMSLAKEACKLFTDMCDYDQARVGFVLFTSKIIDEQPLTELKDASLLSLVHKKLNSINYPKNSGSDHALGLKHAMNMLIQGGSLNGERSPMIILLSDGCIEYVENSRVNIYEQELEETLDFLEEKNIPVYSIALDSAGFADEDLLSSIADQTDALYFKANAAEELSGILSQIMANQLRSNMDSVADFVATGAPQTIPFNIPNDSIYQANIVILSSQGVRDLSICDPNGNELKIPSNKVLVSNEKNYTLIKIVNPAKGDWELTLTGADKDHITINLINSYDMQFMLRADKYEAGNGETIKFDVYCDKLAGESDKTIFEGADGTLTYKHLESGDENQVDLAWDGAVMTASIQFTRAGNYEISGHIVGKDNSYDRNIIPTTVKIAPYPLVSISATTEYKTTLYTSFIGIKFANSTELSIANIFQCDPDATLSVQPAPGGWEDCCDFAFDGQTNKITVTAKASGNARIDLDIADSFGQCATYTVRIKVLPGWLPFVIAIVVIAVIVGLILLIKKITQPLIAGKLKLSVVLPSELSNMTPPELE